MLGPDRARRVRDPLLAQPAVVKLAFQPRALVSLERALKTTTTLRGQSAHLRKLRVKTLHASTKAIHRNSVLTPWATADPKNHAQAPKTAKMRYTHKITSNWLYFSKMIEISDFHKNQKSIWRSLHAGSPFPVPMRLAKR